MLAILLALPACSPEQSAYQEHMKAWSAEQERRTDQIANELAALRNAIERPQPTMREHPWQLLEAKAAGKEGIFLLDRSSGDTWVLNSGSNTWWAPLKMYVFKSDAGPWNYGWNDTAATAMATNELTPLLRDYLSTNAPLTSPTNQPTSTR